MNNFSQKRDNEIDMLQGNINRMCVTDDYDELFDMAIWAIRRICTLHSLNRERLREVKADSDKGVLEKINEEQNSLIDTCKAWDEAISRDGYVN